MPEEWKAKYRSASAPERQPERQRTVRSTPQRTRSPSPPQATQPAAPAPPALPSRRPDELVAAGLADPAIEALVGEGFTVITRSPVDLLDGDLVRFRIPDGASLTAARATVEQASATATVDFNTIYAPSQAPCEGLACQQLAMVDWPEAAQEAAACGTDITIGLVDTGINPEHEALAAANITLLSLLNDAPVVSRRSHGTAVAAVLVGSGDPRIRGLLPNASIIAVDAFEEDPQGRTFSDAFRLVTAIDTVAKRTPDVINLSLSGPENAVLGRAVTAVAERGILMVGAVGNAGASAPPQYPAAFGPVIAATAVDPNLRVYRRAVRGSHVEFAAPGVRVWTAASVRGAKPKTGTSFAAPFVTAAAALAVKSGTDDRESVVQRLADTAEDLGPAGRDTLYGYGLVKASGLCGTPAPGPTVTTVSADTNTDADPGAFTLSDD